jgi:hypothetical protein
MENIEPYLEYIDHALTKEVLKTKSSRWLPYIGNNYRKSPNRTLIIGLSHYDLGDKLSWTKCLEGSAPNLESVVSNGLSIYDKRANNNRMFRGLERVFFNVSQNEVKSDAFNVSREKLWSSVAFHQLVETPMIGNRAHDKKIEKEEIRNGRALEKVVNLILTIEPTNIIMLSNNYMYHSELEKLSGMSERHDRRIYETPIPNKTDIRTCFFSLNTREFTFSAILHPSRYQRINYQNALLRQTIPDFLDYLKSS